MSDPAEIQSNSPIVAAFTARTKKSAEFFHRAQQSLPSGIAHDVRHIDPYPVYIERAKGSRKWDVDGNEYVDYFGGHGALLLGHNRVEVAEAVKRQMDIGTHFGSCHELELRWSELIQELMPSAERVRFTASGTEATLLALRLARAFTGRRKVARFRYHFHGWHDHFAANYVSHFDGSTPTGLLPSLGDDVIALQPGDIDLVRRTLEADNDVAALFLEPTGASWGRIPLRPEFLHELREVTAKHGVMLVFDEVICGFRVSPGGAQGELGVRPDLTTLAKIVAGGLPGGAVAGRRDVLDLLDFEATAAAGKEKILHFGTFNANPVSAAAAVATLEIIKSTDACARANAFTAALLDDLNQAIEDVGLPWAAYGTYSGFHIFTNPDGDDIGPGNFDPYTQNPNSLRLNDPEVVNKLRLGMMAFGVDINGWPGGIVSAAHDDEDRQITVAAFRQTVEMMKDEGVLG